MSRVQPLPLAPTHLLWRACNLPLLLAVLLMFTAFGRLNLWLPLCLGEACAQLQSGPGAFPLLCSLASLALLSTRQPRSSWQASHWAYHRRTIVIGSLCACTLMLVMIFSGAVPIEHIAGLPLAAPRPSLAFLASLGGLTTWLLARCLVSAHAASACRPVANVSSYLW